MAPVPCCRPTLYQRTIHQIEPGGSHGQVPHFGCSAPRSRWRLLRSGGVGRRRRPFRGNGGSAPKACTDGWSFIATNCQLTWQGITVFGIVDTGAGWQSHGAAFDPKSAVGSSYLIQKQNRGSIWTLAPNALSNSFIGIKGIEPIGGNVSVVFDLDAGFDPYSLQFSNGPE